MHDPSIWETDPVVVVVFLVFAGCCLAFMFYRAVRYTRYMRRLKRGERN